jgi:hypothetical protein
VIKSAQLTEHKKEKKSEAEHLPHCVACREELHVGASICPTCKSYQRPWKNHLQYGAGVVTLFVLILSALAWLGDKAHKQFFLREDVRLVACDSMQAAVVQNKGDEEVFVSHLLLWMTGRTSGWIAQGLDINERLPPGQFLKSDFGPSRIKGKALFVHGLNDADFQKLMTRAAAEDPCVEAIFYSNSDSGLRDMTEMNRGRPLNTFAVAGYLEYWGKSLSRIAIEGTGVLQRAARPECN